MNEFPHLRILENEEEKQSIDDASFVTARENFTMDRRRTLLSAGRRPMISLGGVEISRLDRSQGSAMAGNRGVYKAVVRGLTCVQSGVSRRTAAAPRLLYSY
ncbi:hypothetical protein Y032_0014g2449 [Ancylostoma ceylanicum]|uniref:Uncharacterized protein n=1 Tax=Ancylostoma ceylanicum TaxID=53326 RepID=A0A016VC81_9BILA|nr:hypothetical protein Y032_0014g2449 [Ancylostoma ceylanicum]